MDFLDPAKKRAHTIRLFIGYGLMAILILFAAVILMYRAYGYDFDRSTGTVIQKGLVFVSAAPESAAIYINGQQQGNRTDSRFELPSGEYTVELRADGYRSWKRSFDLQGGSIVRLAYPRLFPERLVTAEETVYTAQPDLLLHSPDRRWIMIRNTDALGSFAVYDLANPADEPEEITFPTALFTAAEGSHSLQLAEWSTDNRHVMVKHTFTGGSEFIMLDRERPEESFNINQRFNAAPTRVVLRDKRFDQLYFYTTDGGVLQTVNVSNGQVELVLRNVLDFKGHEGNVLVYAHDSGAGETVNIMVRDNDTSYKLREAKRSSIYLLDVATFDGNWYFVAGSQADKRAYIYKNPVAFLRRDTEQAPVPIAVLKGGAPSVVSFSQNARMIGLQDGQDFAVYDAETERQYRYTIPNPFDAGSTPRWMDGHRYVAVSEGKTLVFDFDGINIQSLTASVPNVSPGFDRDYEALYTVGPSTSTEGSLALIRTELVATTE